MNRRTWVYLQGHETGSILPMKYRLLTLIALLTLGPPALAQGYNVELTPFGGYRFGGDFDVSTDTDMMSTADSVELADSSSYGMLVDIRHSDITTYQFLYSEQTTDAEIRGTNLAFDSIDTTVRVFQLGGTYRGAGDRVQPYLAATVGGTHIRTSGLDSQSDTFFSGSIGVGVNVMPTSRVGLRFEARAYGTLTDSDTDLFCRTGPDINFCAVRVQGTILGQVEAFAGITVRF